MEELLDSGDCTNINVGAGFAGVSRASRSVSSVRLTFTARVVECGNLTRGCLGGGGRPTRKSSLSSADRGDIDKDDVVISETEGRRALVLSSCSSSKSRLGEMISARFVSISRWFEEASIGMAGGSHSQENKER